MRFFAALLVRNLAEVFKWPNLLWHLAAAVLTFLLVDSGFDWLYFQATRGIDNGWVWYPAAVFGGILPILAPIILFLSGWLRNNPRLRVAGLALAQAVILGSGISSAYKAVTGRVPPDYASAAAEDLSRQFRFGFLEGGIFWGWPSSHTTIAFAMALTLAALYPSRRLLRLSALSYALYVGFGASVGFHWFSEFAAGIIFGSLIGWVVGKNIRQFDLSQDSRSA